MKSIRELSEKDLRDRVEQMRSELSKLQTENAKGTLRKETGKIRKVRKILLLIAFFGLPRSTPRPPSRAPSARPRGP